MEQYEIERLYKQGKMPDWFYYQQIDKPVWIKVEEQKQKFNERIQKRQQQQELNEFLEEQISDIFGDFFKKIRCN